LFIYIFSYNVTHTLVFGRRMDQNHAYGVLCKLELGLLVLSDTAAELVQWDRVQNLIKGVEIVVFYLDNEFSYTNS
jgi:hypothetical protein